MSAVSVTTTAVVINALEATEFTVGSAEAGGRNQGGQVGHGGFLYRGRQGSLAHRRQERVHPFFQRGQVGRCVFGRVPGVAETLGVVIADDCIPVCLSVGIPTAPGRCPVREMPGQDECVLRLCSSGDVALKADGTYRIALGRFGPKMAIV